MSNDVIVHNNKVAWHRANDNNIETYKELVNETLKQIRFDSDLFKCTNVTCLEHNNMLQSVYEGVLSICISSADKVNAGHCREQRVPGWDDHVAEYHQEALYWHYWWKVEGRPHQGHTSEMRRISRARYHEVHKIILKEQVSIRKEKMAEAVYHNNSGDLFSEVRKMNTGKGSQPLSFDGKAENNDIWQIFSDKFDELYNSVPYDADLFQTIKDKINQRVLNKNCCNFDVTVQDVVKAVQHLKLEKSGGEEAFILIILLMHHIDYW